MSLTIAQKADTLGTFRFVFVRLMETLAQWVPTSAELEAKTLFGRHIWVLAQHADLLGNRTVELRAKLHYERPAGSAYQSALRFVAGESASGNRVAGFYDAILPDLASRLEQYLADTDELLDAPSVDIVARILSDIERMQRDRRQFERERPDVAPSNEWLGAVRKMLADSSQFVQHREAATT